MQKDISLLIGQKFGRLLIIKEVQPFSQGGDRRRILAKCDCGTQQMYRLRSVLRGKTKSCGCLKKEIFYENNKHLIGTKFGRLTILKLTAERKALCQCECGKEKEFLLDNLKQGSSKSCGCLFVDTNKLRTGKRFLKLKHGLTKHPLYRVYQSMLGRCYNPKNQRYKDYGGKGIYIDNNWLGITGFVNFYQDMVTEYKKGLTIDRINNDGPYSKKNCRWANSKQQNRNKSTNRLIEYNGETKCLIEWAEIYKLKECTLYYRLKRGWPIEKALTTPLMRQQSIKTNN